MKYLIFTLIILILAPGLCAQDRKIDSLRAIARSEKVDSNVVKAYISLSIYLLNSNYDSSIRYAQKAIQAAQISGERRREADAYNRLGTAYNYKGDYEESLDAYTHAIEIFRELNLPLETGKALNNIGFMYRNMADYPMALEYLIQSMVLKEKYGTAVDVGVVYQNIGIVYAIQGEYEKAGEYMEKSRKNYLEAGDSSKLYSVMIDLSSLFRETGKYEESEALLMKTLKYHERNNNKSEMGTCYYNLAYSFKTKEQWEDAIPYFEKARQIFIELGNKMRLIGCYTQLGEVQYKTGNYAKALANVNEGLSLVHETSSPVQEYRLYELKSRIYVKLSNYKEAYEAHLKYFNLLDSMNQEEQNLKLLELQERYDKEKGKRELAEYKVQTEKQNKRDAIKNYILIGIALIAFFLALMAYSRFRNKKRTNEALHEKNKIIQHSLDEKEVLLREIHHRVQNNLQFVSSMLNLQSRRVDDEYTLNVLKDCKLRIQSMALIHQKLYQEDSLKGINILNYTQNLIDSLMHSYQIDSSKVHVELDVDQIYLDINSSISIGLILNELITNAFKYAFKETDQGELQVSLKEEGKALRIRVKDNGPGLPEEFDPDNADSFGLKLVKSLSGKLKAELTMSNDNGTLADLYIRNYERVEHGA